jgi:hypothetical protein
MKKLPFEIVSQERRQGRVKLNLRVNEFLSIQAGAPSTSIADVIEQAETILSQARTDGGQGLGDSIARLSEAYRASQSAPPATPDFQTLDELKPKETDYIFPLFRALSATTVEGYWLDYSKPGVLQAAVPLLQNQTVYADHVYWHVADWVGVVQESTWDAKGEQSGGTPGINAKLKIDWKKNPWIARGLMMTPPAIHSVSVTVLFEYDFSHPELVEQGRFWDLLGEEVEGQIVRLIVTKILGFWELSLVFQGADTQAKRLEEGEQETEMTAARRGPTTIKESTTVKLTAELKKMLGLTEHQGDDVAEATVLQAVPALAARAEAGDRVVTSQRTECLRVAKLAIVGAGEGDLPKALENQIKSASGEDLEGLITFYTQQAEQKFPQACQKCGAKQVQGRSSVEERKEIEKASQTKQPRKPAPARSIF